MSSPRTRLAIAIRASRRHRPGLMVLHLGLRADRQLHPDVAAFEDIHRVHDVVVIRRFQRHIRADLVFRDPGLAPVIQHIHLVRAIVVRASHRIVASDRRIRGHDLLVGGRGHFLLCVHRPFHDQVPRGRAGAVANLIVVHHAPRLYLRGQIETCRRSRQRRRHVRRQQQSARIMSRHALAQLEFERINLARIGFHSDAGSCVRQQRPVFLQP